MVKIREFQQNDANQISAWKLSESDLLFWAHITEANVDLRQKIKEWHSDLDISAFVLELDGKVVAYGEIWIEEQEVELARLLVKPDVRGQGLGRTLLNHLLKRAELFKLKVWLRVHPNNLHAKDLYTRNGFSVAAEELQKKFNHHQPIPFVWMEAVR